MQLDYQHQASNLLAQIKNSAQVTLEKIGSKYALSFPVAFISYFWASFISAGFDSVRFGTNPALWLLASTIAHTILILIAIPIRLTLLPYKDRPSKPLVTLLVFAAFALTRSFLIGELAVYFNLAPTQEYGYRQIAGLMSITVGLSLTTVMVYSFANRQEALQQLIFERSQLEDFQSQAENLFNERQAEIQEIIDQSIKPSLTEIRKSLSNSKEIDQNLALSTSNQISELINDRLRPISESLHQPGTILKAQTAGKPKLALRLRRASTVQVNNLINPFSITFLLVAATISGSVYYAGFAAVPLAIAMYTPFLIMTLVARSLIPSSLKLNFWIALPVSVVSHTVMGIPTYYLIYFFSQFFTGIDRQLAVSVVGISFISLGVALISAFESEQLAFEKDYKRTNAEISELLINLNQRIWLIRKNTAQLLHGSVQAALTAANIRLHQKDISPDDLERINADLERAMKSLASQVKTDFNLEDALEEMIELWEGVCDIDVILTPEVALATSFDLDAAHCVNEFVKECVNNAIKHGKASEVDVHVDLASDIRIEVRVANNGEYLPENRAGLGTRILDEISTGWDRVRTPEGTLVTGQIAVIPKESQNPLISRV